MRRNAISVSLVLVLVASTSVCLAGRSGETAECHRGGHRRAALSHARNAPSVDSIRCSPELKAGLARCGIRGFDQSQFAPIGAASVRPALVRIRNLEILEHSEVRVFSTGSPQTDRGPPRS